MDKKKITNLAFLFGSIALFFVTFFRLYREYLRLPGLVDFAAYCAISRAMFEGINPFPDHFELLFCQYKWGASVPIVFPGQWPFFAFFGYLWGPAIQIAYYVLNIVIICFLTAWTLVKACGFHWHDLWRPGKKQFLYALCCCWFLSSSTNFDCMACGQIPIILTFLVYCLFWGPAFRWLQVLMFTFIAVAKYSILPVFAPLLFFKGHWKFCLISFSLFILLSISPFFFGNNLVDLYSGYLKAVQMTFEPGGVNHYGTAPLMCHFGFFKIPILNHLIKIPVVGLILWIFWREHKKTALSDTLLLVTFSLTLLISYHRQYDTCLVYPLFVIRLFDFSKKRQWMLFGITVFFPLFLIAPRTITYLMIPSFLGKMMIWAEPYIYMHNNPWGVSYTHLFPLTPFFTAMLAIWSFYLYLHVKEPYMFMIPEVGNSAANSKE